MCRTTIIALRRIQNFLLLAELDCTIRKEPADPVTHALEVVGKSFTWERASASVVKGLQGGKGGKGGKGRKGGAGSQGGQGGKGGKGGEGGRDAGKGKKAGKASAKKGARGGTKQGNDGMDGKDGKEATETVPPSLTDIDVKVRHGELVAVVGPVGCGKSTLLSAMLGEIDPAAGGHVGIHGTIGYCAQQPWIKNGRLQENILFGSAMNAKQYQKAIQVCALEADITQIGGL